MDGATTLSYHLDCDYAHAQNFVPYLTAFCAIANQDKPVPVLVYRCIPTCAVDDEHHKPEATLFEGHQGVICTQTPLACIRRAHIHGKLWQLAKIRRQGRPLPQHDPRGVAERGAPRHGL